MAKGISIGVAADTREFSQGVKSGIITPLEGAVDALDDVQRAGDKAGNDLERGFERAQDATKDLKREQGELAREVSRKSKDAGDDIGRNYKKGTDTANDGVKEMGRESASTAKESAASFDGSAESIADAFQEVAANAFAGFGPAGLIAGIAAAAGIGLALQAITDGQERTEAFKARVQDLAAEFIETGETGAASVDFIVESLKELATGTEEGAVKLADLAKIAAGSKSSFKDLAQAYAGNVDGLDKLLRKEEDLRTALEDEAQNLDQTTDAGNRRYGEIQRQLGAKDQYISYLTDSAGAARDAATAERLFIEAGGDKIAAKAALIATVDQAYDDAAGAVTDYVNKETGVFDVAGYVTAMQAREQALRDYQTTLETSALSPQAKTFLDSQGQVAAATFLAGYKAATPAQQAELNRIWTEGGKTSSGAFSRSLEAGVPLTLAARTVTVTPKFDDADFNRRLSGSRTVNVNVEAFTRNGTRVF